MPFSVLFHSSERLDLSVMSDDRQTDRQTDHQKGLVRDWFLAFQHLGACAILYLRRRERS